MLTKLKFLFELIIFYLINFIVFYGSEKILRYLTNDTEYNISIHILIIIIFVFSNIIVINIGLFYQKETLANVCLKNKKKLKIWVSVFLCTMGYIILSYYLRDFLYWIFSGFEMFPYSDGINGINILFVIQTCLIPAVGEEIIIKGIINTRLEKQFNRKVAVIISSLFFSLEHLSLELFIHYFIFSIFTFWIYFKTKTILLPMFVHFINNIFAYDIFYGIFKIPHIYFIAIIIFLIGLFAIIKTTENEGKKSNNKINILK